MGLAEFFGFDWLALPGWAGLGAFFDLTGSRFWIALICALAGAYMLSQKTSDAGPFSFPVNLLAMFMGAVLANWFGSGVELPLEPTVVYPTIMSLTGMCLVSLSIIRGVMSSFLHKLHVWFSLDSEPFMLAAVMCLFGAYVLTQLLKNVAVGLTYYPVMLVSSIVAIGIGTEYGLIGHWQSSMSFVLAAICLGMSLSSILLLSAIALFNRSSS